MTPPATTNRATQMPDSAPTSARPAEDVRVQEASRHLGVLVLDGRRHDDGADRPDPGGDRPGGRGSDEGSPGDAPPGQSEAILVDFRSTESYADVVGEGRRFTSAYLVLLDESGPGPEQIIKLSIDSLDRPGEAAPSRDVVASVAEALRQRRGEQLPAARPRRLGDLTIDAAAREVRRGDEEINLTRTEFDILEALSARPGAVLTRTELLEAVWGPGWYGNDHVVDVHMSKLRSKLGDTAGGHRYIRTVRGVGFRTR